LEGIQVKLMDKKEYIRLLQDAFEQFNKKTEDLTQAYYQLQQKASEIDNELEKRNIELKEKNIQLDSTTRHLNNLVTNMPSALIALDGLKRIQTVNPAASRMFGIKEKELKGKTITDFALFHPLEAVIESTVSGQSVINREVLLNIHSGGKMRPVWVEVSASLIRDEEELGGILIIMNDLTEIRDLRDRVVRNENLAGLGQMAVSVAHEIRNPLGGIEGFAALLRKDLENDPKKRELADKILQGSRDLNTFITQLLEFARPLKIMTKKERIIDIIEKAVSFAMSGNGSFSKDVVVKKVYRDDVVQETDGQLLFQMLLNLILNAFESMEGRGTCEVSLRIIDDISRQGAADKVIKSLNYRETTPFACISVKDTGPGIEKSFMDEIFKPFVTSKAFGTGLGLSMVQKIMDAMNGRIDVISRKDRETVFKIYIPMDAVQGKKKKSTAKGAAHD
jgi:PAS domain S-box-containing protein